jgi:hypothetical protein
MEQNYQTTTEAPKLRIATTVTETVKKTIDRELTLPYYFEYNGDLYKVCSPDFTLRVRNEKDWWGVKVLPTKMYSEEIGAGKAIEQAEFDAAFQNAFMYADLIYRNEEPSREKDENEEIDQILENRVA